MSTSATSRGFTSIAYLIAIQVISRGLTFAGNQALLRYVSPGHLGLAVQLEALSISVLYTSRESLRVALQRIPRQKSKSDANAQNVQLQSAVNASYLVVLLGSLLGLLLGTSYLYPAGHDLLNTTDFKPAFWLYAAATVIELLSEPGFVVVQHNALFKVRARAETAAAITKCVAACSSAILMQRLGSPMSVLPFAIGQVCYATALLSVYHSSSLSLTMTDHFSLLPSKIDAESDPMLSMFSKPLLALAGAFYGQSIFKWLLTQGDTLVLSFFADLEAQGIFALASNYGGLASRLLFQPVEESSRNVFGRLLSTDSNSGKGARSPSVHQRQQAMDYLSTTLHLYILLILMPCVAILPYCFPVLISTLLGSKSQWNSTNTMALLQVYSYYIPTLAVNGILDAFVTSVATEAELGAQSLMMLGVTMIYLSAAYFSMTVMQLGAVGLVYANILNMLLRSGFSIWLIREWIQQNMPPKPGQKESAFRNFTRRATPTYSCLSTFILVVLGLYGKEHVKSSLQGYAFLEQSSHSKLASLGLDLFDITYLFSLAVILISSIVLTERNFLIKTVEPVIPQRIKDKIHLYVGRGDQQKEKKDN